MRKGFTLIELLAVIVILAIIAVIAVPIVLDIINDSKESSTLRSADFYVGALENEIALENMKTGGTLNPKKCIINGDTAKCSGVSLKVKVDGEVPTSGIVIFSAGIVSRISLDYSNGSVMTGTDGTLIFKTDSLQKITEEKYKEYQKKVKAGSADVQGKTAHVWIREELTKEGIYSNDIVIESDGRVVVGTSSIATNLFEAGIPIGTKVEGYDISTNPIKSYTTDGKEYITKEKPEGESQTINVATDVSWSYMGISNDGEALIVLDLDEPSVADADATGVYSTVRLGGHGGYLNGVNVLNTACEKLYSTSKGKARSINYEDVLTGLRYEGPIATYIDNSNTTIELNEIKTIGQLLAEGNTLKIEDTIRTVTPNLDINDRTSIEAYEVDYIRIDIREISNGQLIDVFEPDDVKADKNVIDVILGTVDINYWIADQAVEVDFSSTVKKAYYDIRRGNCKNLSAAKMMESFYGKTSGYQYRVKGNKGEVVLKPVVELVDDLEFTYADNTLNLLD